MEDELRVGPYVLRWIAELISGALVDDCYRRSGVSAAVADHLRSHPSRQPLTASQKGRSEVSSLEVELSVLEPLEEVALCEDLANRLGVNILSGRTHVGS